MAPGPLLPAASADRPVPTGQRQSTPGPWLTRYCSHGRLAGDFSDLVMDQNRSERFHGEAFGIWWASLESNQAPTDYESAALTKHELEALQETPHPRPSPASGTGEKDALPAYGREKEGRAAY